MFWCSACDMPHRVGVGEGAGPRWGWNGDAERPTFSPSVRVTWEQWAPPATTLEIAAAIRRGEIVQTRVPHVCHSFVIDGRIEYLGDCTHALAGQKVDLADWPDLED